MRPFLERRPCVHVAAVVTTRGGGERESTWSSRRRPWRRRTWTWRRRRGTWSVLSV